MLREQGRKSRRASFSRGPMIRLGRLRFGHISGKTFTVTSAEDCREPAEACASEVSSLAHSKVAPLRHDLERFFWALLSIPHVTSVALVNTRESGISNALAIEASIDVLPASADAYAVAIEGISLASSALGERSRALRAGVNVSFATRETLLADPDALRSQYEADGADLLVLVLFGATEHAIG